MKVKIKLPNVNIDKNIIFEEKNRFNEVADFKF